MKRNRIRILLARKKREPETKASHWAVYGIIAGWVIAGVSLYFTAENIQETEKWQKNQFIATQFEKFNSSFSVRFVGKMLDYDARNLSLEDSGAKKMLVTRDMVSIYLDDSLYKAYASTLSKEESGKANEIKVRVRDILDDYLDRLSLFYRYYNSEVVTVDDIRPYLEYQIKKIGDVTTRSVHLRELQKSMWNFIGIYNFNEIPRLCQLFGYEIKTPASVQ